MNRGIKGEKSVTNTYRRTITLLVVAFVLVGLAGVVSAAPTPTSLAIPTGIDVIKYPIFEKPLTQEEVARLGLRLKRFNIPSVGFNHHRTIGRFVYEQFPVDAMFYVDALDRPIYLVECGNRVGAVKFLFAPEPSTGAPIPSMPDGGWFGRRGKAIDDFGRWIWDNFLR